MGETVGELIARVGINEALNTILAENIHLRTELDKLGYYSRDKVLVNRADLEDIINWWRTANQAPGGCSFLEMNNGMRDSVFLVHQQIQAADVAILRDWGYEPR